MKKLKSHLKFAYQFIVSSIGFYPTLISVLFFLLALVIIYFETIGLSEVFKEILPFFIITNGSTARLVLSSITTGVISLMVFSFTMVMLVLNQASSNFSPRVIPGLITYKSNQKILGLYLGTLIYTLVVMVNIRSEFYSEELPGFAIFLAMCFTIFCLGFFVYFIHSISQTIQIDNILETIYKATRHGLLKEEEKKLDGFPEEFNTAAWEKVLSPRTGYLQSIDNVQVVSLCKKYDVLLEFIQPLGNFVIQDTPFLRVSKPLPDMEKFCNELLEHVNFYKAEMINTNYLYGFKQITESAIKALSPSINDPGTAVRAIDYLTDLLVIRMRLIDEEILFDKEKQARVRLVRENFDELCALCLSPIRLYGKSDMIIVLRLLYLLRNLLLKVEAYPDRKPVVYNQLLLLLHDADSQVHNPGDREKLNEQIVTLNELNVLSYHLPLLTLEKR
ncbi:DUF2254 domain-containing protein [Botryobacter ruber]|uniref:DUF2254 domain-containing protein n=1 Tax=Botryobacter ruber TaxID=2171629 RepID=UPI000E0B43BC|nr:DUF2254 domain-containing protein [Botryobacter ruber]